MTLIFIQVRIRGSKILEYRMMICHLLNASEKNSYVAILWKRENACSVQFELVPKSWGTSDSSGDFHRDLFLPF